MSESEEKFGTPGLGAPNTINAVVLVDPETGATFEHTGPYSFRRDAGDWEADIPADREERGGIEATTAESITDSVGEIALAYVDTRIEASGVIQAADVIEGTLTIRVDDPDHASPEDVDVDLSEVDS